MGESTAEMSLMEVFVRDEVPALAMHTAGLSFATFLCWLVSEGKGAARRDFAHILVWFPFNVLLLYAAGSACYDLRGSTTERYFAKSASSHTFMHMYISAQFIGVVLQASSDDLRKQVPILTHHVVSIVCYAGGLYFQRMHFWACADGMCEVTTLFLNVLMLSKTKTKTAEWMAANIPLLLKCNGFMLWLTFIIFRLVLFSCWLVGISFDFFHLSAVQRSEITRLEMVVYPATNVFLLVLSYTWFTKIHAGMMKVLSADTKPLTGKFSSEIQTKQE